MKYSIVNYKIVSYLDEIVTQKHLKSTASKRAPLWLPYLSSIKETRGGVFEFTYNGGVETSTLDKITSIMIYGESDLTVSIKILEKIARFGIPTIIHRRNVAQPVIIMAGLRPDKDDTLTAQIRLRLQERVKTHVTRQVLKTKMTSMSWLTPATQLPQYASIKKLRNLEAVHAKYYWRKFFSYLDLPGVGRREESAVKSALDAQSKFLSGIILRWITYHHLSPYHGFFHETTNYPSLVYDLIEPYRGLFEKTALIHWKQNVIKPEDFLATGIVVTKEFLNSTCYVPLTRQVVTYQELLHGVVLSLKYYLLGKQRKFLIPTPGKVTGGRPPKVAFLLYGRHAGKTNFWQEAREAAAHG